MSVSQPGQQNGLRQTAPPHTTALSQTASMMHAAGSVQTPRRGAQQISPARQTFGPQTVGPEAGASSAPASEVTSSITEPSVPASRGAVE
jgi:hypothetical protein